MTVSMPVSNAPDDRDAADPALHDTFVVTRLLPGTPAQVFAMFAQAEHWRRWFRLPGAHAAYDLDFRVGGGASARSSFTLPSIDRTTGDGAPAGELTEELAYASHFIEIVPPRRLVFTYAATVQAVLRWTALVTIELNAQTTGDDAGPARTLLRRTEQVAFLAPTTGSDGADDLAHVRGGTQLQLNALAAALERDTPLPA